MSSPRSSLRPVPWSPCHQHMKIKQTADELRVKGGDRGALRLQVIPQLRPPCGCAAPPTPSGLSGNRWLLESQLVFVFCNLYVRDQTDSSENIWELHWTNGPESCCVWDAADLSSCTVNTHTHTLDLLAAGRSCVWSLFLMSRITRSIWRGCIVCVCAVWWWWLVLQMSWSGPQWWRCLCRSRPGQQLEF